MENKMNTMTHAEKEFEILLKHIPDAIIKRHEAAILALVKSVACSGQSGASMPYTAKAVASAVKTLCLQEPLYGIMNDDSEWNDVTEMMGENDRKDYQNNRLSSVFKEGKDGKPYYLEAIIFKSQNDSSYSSNSVLMEDGTKMTSRQYIRTFPFQPKTFYIDVIDTEWSDKEETVEEQGGGWWTSVIKDEKQLEKVFEYYNKYAKYE